MCNRNKLCNKKFYKLMFKIMKKTMKNKKYANKHHQMQNIQNNCFEPKQCNMIKSHTIIVHECGKIACFTCFHLIKDCIMLF